MTDVTVGPTSAAFPSPSLFPGLNLFPGSQEIAATAYASAPAGRVVVWDLRPGSRRRSMIYLPPTAAMQFSAP